MPRFLLILISHLLGLSVLAEVIPVTNIEELNAANKRAKAGDTVLLRNGEWKDVSILLNCHGTKVRPIVFKAETNGKVLITGQSYLKIGGTYIVVEGLYFTRGYSGNEAVISFKGNKVELANYCKVTQCVIDDFNNPLRMDENNWVLLYGKRNTVEACSFINKKNMGVLLAVILEDDRSRENYHAIRRNYFGRRIPLASNGGEIIRVGVSQHCQYNSYTEIASNFFEHCDGETEIISIKSGRNAVEENVFKECQGSVVLRHGDYNRVAGNYFIGNDKTATGGVRVINKGQAVISNVFYKCRGTGFRSPLAIMNGIPNSPAHRYVQVTDAEIADNMFYECAPMSLGEGSDTERTLPPAQVAFYRNRFYNTRDSVIFRAWDKIDGIKFSNNTVSKNLRQQLPPGFVKTNVPAQKKSGSSRIEYPHVDNLAEAEKDARESSGAAWFATRSLPEKNAQVTVSCASSFELYKQLSRPEHVVINLTGREYLLDRPLVIKKNVRFVGNKSVPIRFESNDIPAAFLVEGKGNLIVENLQADGTGFKGRAFISNDSTGHSDHFNLVIRNSSFKNFSRNNGCERFIYIYKSMVADSIVIRNNQFTKNDLDWLLMEDEIDDKGYYNAERIVINKNSFHELNGRMISLYRGGNDESTLGPDFTFSGNRISKSVSPSGTSLIQLFGVQSSLIEKNQFTNSNPNRILIRYDDLVRARHIYKNNTLTQSGHVLSNRYVVKN